MRRQISALPSREAPPRTLELISSWVSASGFANAEHIGPGEYADKLTLGLDDREPLDFSVQHERRGLRDR